MAYVKFAKSGNTDQRSTKRLQFVVIQFQMLDTGNRFAYDLK